MNALKQVTDRFSLFRDGRKIGANNRKYVIKAAQDMVNSERTRELIRLGEAYGYYGHAPRQRANKLTIGESEVIMINGRPVLVDNIPSNRTLDISVSDDGIVEHTQEFLDTETGKIALGLNNSRAGGWSWATGGVDAPQAAVTTTYHGMDYVLQPNFISLDHPSMMMESANGEQMLLESLRDQGFDVESVSNIISSIKSPVFVDANELETQVMLLEGLNAELREKALETESLLKKHQADSSRMTSMLLEAAESMPFYMTDQQRAALSKMETEHDLRIVKAMFESLGSSKLSTLPTAAYESSVVGAAPRVDNSLVGNMIDFGGSRRRFD